MKWNKKFDVNNTTQFHSRIYIYHKFTYMKKVKQKENAIKGKKRKH